MNYIAKFVTNFREFYNEMNSATLTGAIDVIVIQQPDKSYLCSPFHVRFGKIGVLHSREKVVDIEVNGSPVDIHMKLGESGEAFFVQEVVEKEKVPDHLATSPLPSKPDIEQELRKLKESCNVSLECNSEEHTQDTFIQNEHLSLYSHVEHIDSRGSVTNIVGHHSETCSEFPHTSRNDTSLHNCETNSSPFSSYLEVPTCIKSDTTEVSIAVQTDQLSSGSHSVEVTSQSISVVHTIKVTDNSLPIAHNTHLPNTSVNNSLKDKCVTTLEQDDLKSKRKKKKVGGKKRATSREIAIPIPSGRDSELRENKTSSQTIHPLAKDKDSQILDEPEEIFHMDDDYDEEDEDEDEGCPCISGISRSVSLPITGEDHLPGEWPTRKLSATYAGELHPFSDGDVTPLSSPTGSRPPSPKSDTEYEINKHDATSQTNAIAVQWGWGQLPTNTTEDASSISHQKDMLSSNDEDAVSKSQKAEEEKRSMLGGMLSLMRSTKKLRHKPESEGIYLDDINPDDLDPHVAALYFPKFRSGYPEQSIKATIKDEDAESGNGSSLPHSPHSMDGAVGLHTTDFDIEEKHSLFDYASKFYSDIAMSMCGGLQDGEGELPSERFLHSIVSFDDFSENPSHILQNQNLVIRMGGKYYNWQTASPMLLSLLMYQRPLPEKTVVQLTNDNMPKKKKPKTYSYWWSWRRTPPNTEQEIKKSENAPSSSYTPVDHQPLDVDPVQSTSKGEEPEVSEISNPIASTPSTVVPQIESKEDSTFLGDKVSQPVPVSMDYTPSVRQLCTEEKYMKSLRLSSEQIENLRLRDGPNEVMFSVTTAYQGTTRCKCHIYMWRYDAKVVISDIDGTITKSDVLGHILPIIGKDWAQLGVAKLFSKIKNNGYQFLYLSARAIGQARITRDYLRSVKQGDLCLPDGPLLLSPTSLVNALHREVIEKKPEEFKISCLKDIKALFPACVGNPFYAGFGNKINDTWAYRAVDIPISRIFTINHRGELKLELIQTFQSSYTRLSDVVDHIFPPLHSQMDSNFPATDEYSYFTYWRDPLPSISEDDELLNNL